MALLSIRAPLAFERVDLSVLRHGDGTCHTAMQIRHLHAGCASCEVRSQVFAYIQREGVGIYMYISIYVYMLLP